MSDARPSPSVLGPLRRPAPFVAAVALLIAAVLGVRYAGDPVAGRVDRNAEALVDALTGPHWRWFGLVVQFGSPVSVVFWAVVLAGLALLLRRRRHAVLAVVGPGLTGIVTTLFKPLVGRTIGDDPAFAYPSGHTGGATSTALVIALLLVGLATTRRAVAIAVVASAALLAGGAVGTGMVTLGSHYPTDTVGGFCLAVAIGLGSGLVIDHLADRRTATHAPDPTPG